MLYLYCNFVLDGNSNLFWARQIRQKKGWSYTDDHLSISPQKWVVAFWQKDAPPTIVVVAGLPENDFTRQGKEQEKNTTMPPFSHLHCKDLGGFFFQPPTAEDDCSPCIKRGFDVASKDRSDSRKLSVRVTRRFFFCGYKFRKFNAAKMGGGILFLGERSARDIFPVAASLQKCRYTAVDGGGKQIRFSHYLISSFPRSLIPVCRGAHTVTCMVKF